MTRRLSNLGVNLSSYRSGRTMNLNKHGHSEAAAEETIDEGVAMKIRPLPGNVVPSERFLEQMRLRLLGLQPGPKSPSKRAA